MQKKESNGNGNKCFVEYLEVPEATAKNLCKKLSLHPNDEVLDIVKNVIWASDKFLANAAKIKNKQVNIFTQATGDPDCLAAAKALAELFLLNGANDFRILCSKIGHPQNVEMIQWCNIVVFNPNEGRFENGLNCIVDSSPPLGQRNTQNVVNPPNDLFFVCDHHNEAEPIIELCKSESIKVFIPILGKRIGSTSTMIALMSFNMKQLDNLTAETRAALLLGIYTDTNGMVYNVTSLDSAMFNILNKGKAAEIFSTLQFYEYPDDWLELKHRAYINQIKVGRIRLTTTGLTPDYCRDVIAECANDVIRQKSTAISFCLAITLSGLELSVRANSRLLKMEPDRIINIVGSMFDQLFPGKSGFKFSSSFPHNIEGGACVKLEPIDQIFLNIKDVKPDYNDKETRDKCLARCKEYMESITKVLHLMAANDPELMSGLGLETKDAN